MKLVTILLALASIEGISWWWMHPDPNGQRPPVLVYRPSRSAGVSPAVNEETGDRNQGAGDRDQESEVRDPQLPRENPASTDQQSKINNQQSPISSLSTINPQLSTSSYPQSPISSLSTINSQPSSSSTSPVSASQHFSVSAFTHTPLPELYAKAAPMLRCSSGQVSHVRLTDTLGLHLAFFEWDDSDTGSVLEAFRHMPEDCLGSMGMILVSKERPIPYKVGLDCQAGPLVANGVNRERTAEVREKESRVGDQESEGKSQEKVGPDRRAAPLSANGVTRERNASNPKSKIQNHQSSISPSSPGITLVFDHTIFRDPGQGGGGLLGGPPVHSFRAVWVSGISDSDARTGIAGDSFDRLRTIRLKSALNRFRPSHARVIQGAVRGAISSQAAWQAFESTMLADLKME